MRGASAGATTCARRASRSPASSISSRELRIEMFDLLSALAGIFDRLQASPVHEVVREPYTVDEKMSLIEERIGAGGPVRFEELFADDTIKMEVIVTFIAILELVKRGRLQFLQTEPLGPIWIQRPGVDDERRRRDRTGQPGRGPCREADDDGRRRMGDRSLKRELEALLFATDSPLTRGPPEEDLSRGRDAGAQGGHRRAARRNTTRPGTPSPSSSSAAAGRSPPGRSISPVVEKLLKSRRFTRLSKAGLEVLAIIAYRQPITRLEIDEIRGVNSSGAISTLTERNLITVVGRSETVGNPLLYGTTREFLNHLGLKGLGQLPDLPAIWRASSRTASS